MAPTRRQNIRGFLRDGALLATAAGGAGLTVFAEAAAAPTFPDLAVKLLGDLGVAGALYMLAISKDQRIAELSNRLTTQAENHSKELEQIRAQTAAERNQFVDAVLNQPHQGLQKGQRR